MRLGQTPIVPDSGRVSYLDPLCQDAASSSQKMEDHSEPASEVFEIFGSAWVY